MQPDFHFLISGSELDLVFAEKNDRVPMSQVGYFAETLTTNRRDVLIVAVQQWKCVNFLNTVSLLARVSIRSRQYSPGDRAGDLKFLRTGLLLLMKANQLPKFGIDRGQLPKHLR